MKSRSKEEDLKLTNLDKIFWPKEKITKGDLIEYYRGVSPYILPHLKNRPESLNRFPNGIDDEHFFQKNVGKNLPTWVPVYPVKHSGKTIQYLVIQNLKSLLYTINLGCIELNPLNSRIQKLEYPDYCILDLDPENISFNAVIEAAQVLHEILEENNIPSYCKTSGATGLHIYIPLGAKYTYEQTKQFAEILVTLGHERLPKTTSLLRKPAQRQKKVYLDFLQNNFGQTLAAPYCVRPRQGAPVSTPLEWKEVKLGLDPLNFTMKNTLARLKKKGDLFKPVLGKGIDLLKILRKISK